MLLAFLEIVLYKRPFLLYWRARTYAEYTPLGFLLHVFREQIGNDLLGPRKHFLPQRDNILVLSRLLGAIHPLVGEPLFLRVDDIIYSGYIIF